MKQIRQEGTEANWENAILKDLSFIKKNLRYPITAKTLAPMLVLIAFLLLSLWLVWSTVFVDTNNKSSILILLPVTIAIWVSVMKFIRTLRFQNIRSPYTLLENIKAIEYFLKSQQLAFSQIPDSPEVFYIISKNISPKGDKREIMFFIADEKRILVNNHFTGRNLLLNPGSGHSRQMAARLEKWLHSFVDSNDNKSTTSINRL